MKILSVADTVVPELLDKARGGPAIDGVELVLSCGDLPPEYLASLRHRYDAPLYYVLGNHDLRYQSAPPVGCRALDRRVMTVGNTRLIGFSGSRWYNGSINQYTEEQMTSFIGRMRFSIWRHRGIDLVLTHAPPRFIHDLEDPCHRGFRVFRRFIDKYQPRFFIHGHVHAHFDTDEQRMTRINSTTVINSYGYIVLEI
jgi:Icc-related predicted phosphoesterase